MRPAWRLAINSAWARRSRSLLLLGAVVLSAALISAVATSLNSLNAAISARTQATVGVGDVSIEPSGSGGDLDAALLARARAWEGVTRAVPRIESTLATLALSREVYVPGPGGEYVLKPVILSAAGAAANGIDPALEPLVRPVRLLAGRLPAAPNEIVVDALLADRLSARAALSPEDEEGFDVISSKVVRARLAEPEPLAGPVTKVRAEKFNERQGVRLGDQLSLVPDAKGVLQMLSILPRLPQGPNMLLALFADARPFSSGFQEIMLRASNPARLVEQIARLRSPRSFRVVGIAEQPPLGARPQAYLTLESLRALTGEGGRLSRIDLVIDDAHDPGALADARRDELGPGVVIQTTEKVTSSLKQNIKSSQLGFLLASVLAFLSAAFIIMTGLTTDVAQRQRELAVVRCVGGSRAQLAGAQLFTGLLLGGLGALIGLPLGIAVAALLAWLRPENLPVGVVVPVEGVVLTLAGCLLAGLAGAAFPAIRAANQSPIEALRSRAHAPSRRAINLALACGLAGVLIHLAIIIFIRDGQRVFWAYVTLGLPGMFIGYFLLSVPVMLLVVRFASPLLSRLLGLPRSLLQRGVRGTPYRYGFTAGAMMTGLALMVAIWTNGGAVLRDWIGRIEFPDAFVSGLPLAPGAEAALRALPEVERTCAITREFVDVDASAALGVRGLQRYATSFIAFDPASFFDITTLTWVQGSREEAQPQLEAGGAVLIAREFHTARGLGVGDTFVCSRHGTRQEFKIVGVVTSPGLDIASRFFNIGEEYTHQAVHSVFGTQRDLRERFGSDEVHIIQVDFRDDVDEARAMRAVRAALIPFGLLDAGSGRQIKDRIRRFARGTLLIFTSVAVIAMLVASFGVANLIAAAVEMRRFEFGVLRAIGARRGMLTRLVIGEAVLIALVAGLVGTVMGLQGAFGGRRLYEALLGIQFQIEPPARPILVGWAFVAALTILAAAPGAARINRRSPRDLLASPK
ncbi:MAG: FtsX-like permease family protein [Phycisphaerales bacterium]|nr:FtsX-like permease family protein [Phycisphaerales bacterium]